MSLLKTKNISFISFRLLGMQDLPEIIRLECAAWPSYLRASADNIQKRLEWGHSMLGAFRGEELVAMSANRYGQFNPGDKGTVPKTFDAFANRPNQSPYNAAFIYNFALIPELRKSKLGPNLMMEGINILIEKGCTYLVAPSRCPSYAGSDDILAPCNPSPKIRAALDAYPDSDIPWEDDPVLSFYHRVLGCNFIGALPGFMPEDIASGGFAIGIYKRIDGAQ